MTGSGKKLKQYTKAELIKIVKEAYNQIVKLNDERDRYRETHDEMVGKYAAVNNAYFKADKERARLISILEAIVIK